jgi:hypothetical protein
VRMALLAIRRDSDVTDYTNPAQLKEFRLNGLIYTARMPDGRLMAHLKERGRNALGEE